MEYIGKTVLFLRSMGVHYGWAICLFVLALTFLTRRFWLPRFLATEQKFSVMFGRDLKNYFILAFLPIFLFGSYALLVKQPSPVDHDDFCYLLAGETFAAGKLTNPTPLLWRHFEAIHEIMQPTYMAKYPPGQGLAIASGIALLNSPIFGVWLSGTLAFLAIYWTLRALFSPNRSFFGTLLLLTHYTVFMWSQTFLSGFVALFGGALVFGAVLRFRDKVSIQTGFLLGLGLAALSVSRPFEGLVFSALVILGWVIYFMRQINFSALIGKFLPKIILPATLVLLLSFGWMGVYNRAVTGSFFKLPYAIWVEQYYPIPLFIFQSVRPFPQYNHLLLEKSNQITFDYYQRETTPPLYFLNQFVRIFFLLPFALTNNFFFFSAWLAAIFWARKSRELQFVLLIIFGMLLTVGTLVRDGIYPYFLLHYYAPLYAVQITLVLLTLKKLFETEKYREAAIVLAVSILLGQTTMLIVLGAREKIASQPSDRERISKFLNDSEGLQLVLVDYSLKSNASNEQWLDLLRNNTNFVYNHADIDKSQVIWANNMSREANQELFDYYKGRKVWIVGFDDDNRARLVSCSDTNILPTDEQNIAQKLKQFCPN